MLFMHLFMLLFALLFARRFGAAICGAFWDRYLRGVLGPLSALLFARLFMLLSALLFARLFATAICAASDPTPHVRTEKGRLATEKKAPQAQHGSKAFEKSETRFFIISFTSDWLYPTSENRDIVIALNAIGKDVRVASGKVIYGLHIFGRFVPVPFM